MARINLHTVYPFKAGTTQAISDWHYITIEKETLRSRAGTEPFRVVVHAKGYCREYAYSMITEACEVLPRLVAEMTEYHSAADWSKLPRCHGGWSYENDTHSMLERGAINRMRSDMDWSLERARLEYRTDPSQRF
ncbi:MAG: hypothetical protein DMF06_05175 [Verrucomicrobia bacterium]|nr:MAG: hypothetical protein DMF06_05175 [Verrucomicrobiota bacterium]